jgi:hypothetical protein
MKIPRSRKDSAPRNVAAKALGSGRFKPKVEPDPKAYRRRPKHPKPILPPDDEAPGGEG